MRFGIRGRAAVKPLPLCFYEHPVLRRKSVDVDEITDDIRDFAERMIVTMHENDGIGLAAPQVGRNINLVVIDIPMPETSDGAPLPWNSPGEAMLLPRMPVVIVNPVLSDFSESQYAHEEGCLSIPELRGTVTRPVECTLSAMTLAGLPLNVRCAGLLSRCLQHEVDHLKAILFTDKIPEEEKDAMADKLTRMQRRTQASLKRKRQRG